MIGVRLSLSTLRLSAINRTPAVVLQSSFAGFNSSAVAASAAEPATSVNCTKRTCLYDFHVRHGGKIVEFGGWSMPVQYANMSITSSHLHTRDIVSMFDVSHMLQTIIRGRDRIEFIESLTVADIAGLKDDHGALTLFTSPSGGILDDLIVNKTSLGYLYVVSNAGCADKDLAHMKTALSLFQKKGKDVSLEVVPNGLIAIQGPGMTDLLQPLTDINLSELSFMTTTEGRLLDVPQCRITRCGYTGEDGVEISIPVSKAEHVAQALLNANPTIMLAGLGARDSLRLEAGLCLYGHDIDDKTTPIEASLAWTVAKRRRQEANFPGADIILKQLKDKPLKKRVGFTSVGPPARGGTVILDETGSKRIGVVTSGCPSPSLKTNVAMGYVNVDSSAVGRRVKFEVRKQLVDAEVVKMPFVPTRYYYSK